MPQTHPSSDSIKIELKPIQNLDRNHELREFFWRLYNHPANNIYMFWATRSREKLSFAQENIVFRLMHALCTQDYISSQERRDKIRNIKNSFAAEINNEPLIQEIVKYCDTFMTSKLTHQLSFYSSVNMFWKTSENTEADAKNEVEDYCCSI